MQRRRQQRPHDRVGSVRRPSRGVAGPQASVIGPDLSCTQAACIVELLEASRHPVRCRRQRCSPRGAAPNEVPGISKTFGATDSVHASAICAGVRPSLAASRWTAGWPSTGLSALKPEPSGKNGTNAMPCSHAGVQHRLRRAVDQVVGVLHADDLGAVERDLQMVEADAAQPDAGDEPFVARLDHCGQLSVETVTVDCADRRCVTGVDAA